MEFGSPLDAAGFVSVWARLYTPDAAALHQRVDDIAHTVCPDDPCALKERRADALGALGAGASTLACQCGRDDCEAAHRTRGDRNVIIHVMPATSTAP